MRRTNIYMDEDQLVMLKFLALQQGQTVAELVRTAVNQLLSEQLKNEDKWKTQFNGLINRVRSRIPDNLSSEEIEKDITQAKKEQKKTLRESCC